MPRFIDTNFEPKFDTEITQGQLASALNWYSQNKTKKDAEKYAHDFFKKKHKVDVSDPLQGDVATFGFVCRIVFNGATLPEKNQIWFENKIEELKKLSKWLLKKKQRLLFKNAFLTKLQKSPATLKVQLMITFFLVLTKLLLRMASCMAKQKQCTPIV
jgi:hypothetical protein